MSKEEILKQIAEATKTKSEYQQGMIVGYMSRALDEREAEKETR